MATDLGKMAVLLARNLLFRRGLERPAFAIFAPDVLIQLWQVRASHIPDVPLDLRAIPGELARAADQPGKSPTT